MPKRFLEVFRRQSKKHHGKNAAEKPKKNLSTLSSAEAFLCRKEAGEREKRKRAGNDRIVPSALIVISEFCATGRLEEEDGKMLMCDIRDRAITCLFRRDIFEH